MAKVDERDAAYRGQAAYTRPMLRVYDFMVYRITGPILWRCRRAALLDLYDRYVSARHLDIGVATGYLLARCGFPEPEPQLTLMDLSPSALEFAAHRLRHYAPRTHQANVLAAWGLPAASFDSIGMFNVLHCVPGTMREKAVAFQHAAGALAPGGAVFGSTVLSGGVAQTRRSRTAIRALNRRGVFSNAGDCLEDLEAGIAAAFQSYEVEVHGVVALFRASSPIEAGGESAMRDNEGGADGR